MFFEVFSEISGLGITTHIRIHYHFSTFFQVLVGGSRWGPFS